MTYLWWLDPNSPEYMDMEAQAEREMEAELDAIRDLDANVPDWQAREVEAADPDRFVSESDMDRPTLDEQFIADHFIFVSVRA